MPDRIRYHNPRPLAIKGDDAATRRERDRFYGSARWRALRARFISKNPLCSRCAAEGETRAATIVHHVKERLAHPELAYAWSNLEAVCGPHHTAGHKAGQQG